MLVVKSLNLHGVSGLLDDPEFIAIYILRFNNRELRPQVTRKLSPGWEYWRLSLNVYFYFRGTDTQVGTKLPTVTGKKYAFAGNKVPICI